MKVYQQLVDLGEVLGYLDLVGKNIVLRQLPSFYFLLYNIQRLFLQP
jgi:hypothetical protein